MSRFKFGFILTACLLINACSQLSPYIDRRRNVNAQTAAELYVGPSRPEAPAICYNKLTSTFEEIQKLADAECVEQGNRHACRFGQRNAFYLQAAAAKPLVF